jgi:hypothetical protein
MVMPAAVTAASSVLSCGVLCSTAATEAARGAAAAGFASAVQNTWDVVSRVMDERRSVDTARPLAAVQPTHAHANDGYTRKNVLERLRAAAVDASRNMQVKVMIDLIANAFTERSEGVVQRVQLQAQTRQCAGAVLVQTLKCKPVYI